MPVGDIVLEKNFGQAPRQVVSGTVAVEQPVSVVGPLTNAELRAAPVSVSGVINVSEPVSVEGPLTDTELRAAPVPVSGTVSITEPVSVDDNGGSLTVDGTFLTDAQLRATPVPVSGTVSVTEPVSVDDNGASLTVDGPLTDAELRATPVPVSGTVSVTEPVSVDDNGGSLTVDGPLTDAQLRATPVPVSGTVSVVEPVSVDDAGGSLTVDGTFLTDAQLRATPVPISGALTDAELRATPVPVSGTVSVTEPVSVDDNGGSLTVDGTFLTDAQLRATPVPVSGPLTDAQLRATPVPVSGTVSVTEPVSVDDNGASLTIDTPQLPAALVGGRLDENVGAWLGSTAPTVGQKIMANSVPVVIASDQTSIPVANTPAQNAGKTILFFVLAQGAVPGTTQIAAASPGNKHKIVGVLLTMSTLAGTVKFTGTSDLTGAMTLAINGGFAIQVNPASIFAQTGVNEALSVVSTLGGVNGIVQYLTEP